MKAALSLVSLLSFAALAASSTLPSRGKVLSCAAGASVLVETRNVTAGGHEIQVSTKACSSNIVTSRSFEKRQTLICGQAVTSECETVDGRQAPVPADCVNLQAALPAFIATQPQFFVVAPGSSGTFALGTCLYAWSNNNAVGGVSLEGCWSDMERIGSILTPGCIEAGQPGGIAFPTTAIANEAWTFEVTHS